MVSDCRQSVLDSDPRFGFAWLRGGDARAPLLVAVHGSERDYVETRDAFAGLAAEYGLNVLAPHFPKDVAEAGYSDGYKFLVEDGIDYIALLDRMIAQFAAEAGVTPSSFYLFGFSGGAQFAARYALFEGKRLDGLLLAAPGAVTLIDQTVEWWPGLAGAAAAVGREPDLDAFLRVPMAVLVGERDISAGLTRNDPGLRNGSVHADIAGATRLERARALYHSINAAGGDCRLIEIAGADHKLHPNAQAAGGILAQWLLAASNHDKARD